MQFVPFEKCMKAYVFQIAQELSSDFIFIEHFERYYLRSSTHFFFRQCVLMCTNFGYLHGNLDCCFKIALLWCYMETVFLLGNQNGAILFY